MATINGTAGNDTLTGDDVDLLGNGGDDTIHGLAGNDTIDGLGGSNHLFGDDGDDTFVISKFTPGTTLVDTSYDGGAGFDTLDISRSGPTDQATITQLDDFWVLQTTGQFSINSIRNVEQIILGPFHNTVVLPNWTDNLKIDATHSLSGADINTGKGDDTILGGPNNDQIFYNGGNDLISLGQGDFNRFIVQTVSGHADEVSATAGSGRDTMMVYASALAGGPATIDLQNDSATIGSTTFHLTGFDDIFIESSALVSTASGNEAANLISYINYRTLGGFIFNGNGGDDTLEGGWGGDQLYGGNGNDSIDGHGANDLVSGGVGDDVISGGAGNNILDGGDGNDYINGGGQSPPAALDGSPFVVSGADTITGGDGNDHIWGSAQGVPIVIPDGADSIDGGNGSDYVNGNRGNDTIHGGAGSDRLYGGADDDLLYGDVGDDHLNGNQGNDTLDGGANQDTLFGGADNDLLYGGDDSDTLSGDAGSDTIQGAAGYDVLSGGDGADTFTFGTYGQLSLSEASFDSSGRTDLVTDFQNGADKFALGFTPAVILAGTAQDFASAAVAAQQLLDGHAGDHEVAAVQVGADTYLFFSAMGGGGVNAAVRVAAVSAAIFDTTDFV